MYKLFFVIIPILFLTSCEKEININLNSSNPKFVIEAQLSDDFDDSTLVFVSKTLNFNETVTYPKVNHAFVTLIEDGGVKIDTLSLIRPGVYFKPNLVGISKRSYTLNIMIGTQLFSSTAIMPNRILLDSITEVKPNGGPGGPPGAKPSVVLTPYFTDLKDVTNYYQIVASRNDTLLYNIEMRDDQIFNGLTNQRPMRVEARKNDSIILDLQCVDKQAYDFFLGLASNLGQFSATPSNPPSTFTNGALGYFKVHTSSKRLFIR